MTDKRISQFNGLIIDASIAVKWFSEEQDSARATQYFKAISEYELEAFSPSIICYEVGNALFKGKKYNESRIFLSLKELFSSPLKLVELNSDNANLAVKYMVNYNITFYDAVYASLAKTLNLPLLSANPKDHKKIKEIKVLGLR